MSDRLIVFTRYPQPGKTKTRMISLLGNEGAAMLQRQMTEYTLKIIRKIPNFSNISAAIYFAGDDKQLMQNWLGSDLIYQPQIEGDLGQRMQTAFQESFLTGTTKAIAIGTDCPEINTTIFSKAFKALERYDLVLGPAVDGGYYLIGLNRLIPELFIGINWGTSEVFAQTKKIAQHLKLNVYYLPILNDVDRPEDIYIWQRVSSKFLDD
jgi:hypothetical protein